MKGIPSIQIQTTPARLDLPKIKGNLSIDQYPSRASYNIRTITDLTADAAQSARQTVLETAGRYASEGDMVANQQATVASLAVSAAQPTPVMVDLVTIERPNISYDVTRQDGNYQPGSVDIKV